MKIANIRRWNGWGAALLLALVTGNGSTLARAAELVVYGSSDCVVSQRAHQELASDYGTSPGGRVFPLRHVDIADGSGGVALVHPVTMTPTFVFVDRGREIGRFTGYPGREHFLKLIAAAAGEFLKAGAAAR